MGQMAGKERGGAYRLLRVAGARAALVLAVASSFPAGAVPVGSPLVAGGIEASAGSGSTEPSLATTLTPNLSIDPVLMMAERMDPALRFGELLGGAVLRHPAIAEARAGWDEARAGRSAARAGRLPSLDASVSSYRIVARDFSNDPNNIVERSRAAGRTDATLALNQTLFDFGAGAARVRAADARVGAADASIEAVADDIALRAIGVWYDVFVYRALVSLGEAFLESQREADDAVRQRVSRGVSAEADIIRVEGYITSAEARLARYRRSLASGEARFVELAGAAAPADLGRAPAADGPALSREAAIVAAQALPPVRQALAEAESARQEARALRAETRFNVSAGINAGRYGVFETDRDYDVRGQLTLRQRLFGGVDSRADEADARARAAQARADRIREEARRDAAVAWTDVEALETQLAALRAGYVSSRISRDVTRERFRIARGTLFDLLAAEDTYFEAATSYIEALGELDSARYVLLSRTGRLLAALPIDIAGWGKQP